MYRPRPISHYIAIVHLAYFPKHWKQMENLCLMMWVPFWHLVMCLALLVKCSAVIVDKYFIDCLTLHPGEAIQRTYVTINCCRKIHLKLKHAFKNIYMYLQNWSVEDGEEPIRWKSSMFALLEMQICTNIWLWEYEVSGIQTCKNHRDKSKSLSNLSLLCVIKRQKANYK